MKFFFLKRAEASATCVAVVSRTDTVVDIVVFSAVEVVIVVVAVVVVVVGIVVVVVVVVVAVDEVSVVETGDWVDVFVDKTTIAGSIKTKN